MRPPKSGTKLDTKVRIEVEIFMKNCILPDQMLSPNSTHIIDARQQNIQHNTINGINNTQQRMSSSQQARPMHPVAAVAADMGSGLNNLTGAAISICKKARTNATSLQWHLVPLGMILWMLIFWIYQVGTVLPNNSMTVACTESTNVLCTTIDHPPTCCFTIDHKATSARVCHHN